LLSSTQQQIQPSQTTPTSQQSAQQLQQIQTTPTSQRSAQQLQPSQTTPTSQQSAQQLQQFQLQQSQTTASSQQSAQSLTSTSTPIFIDSDDREIIIRSRSRAKTPGVEADVLAEFGDIARRGTPVEDRSPVRSRRSTPVIEANIEEIVSSTTGKGKQRVLSDERTSRNTKSLEAMLIKQGRQIRALYELQKSTFEKVTSIQKQLKNSNKSIELSSKVFGVSDNFVTDNN
jgi:hypothetical protein